MAAAFCRRRLCSSPGWAIWMAPASGLGGPKLTRSHTVTFGGPRPSFRPSTATRREAALGDPADAAVSRRPLGEPTGLAFGPAGEPSPCCEPAAPSTSRASPLRCSSMPTRRGRSRVWAPESPRSSLCWRRLRCGQTPARGAYPQLGRLGADPHGLRLTQPRPGVHRCAARQTWELLRLVACAPAGLFAERAVDRLWPEASAEAGQKALRNALPPSQWRRRGSDHCA